MGRRLAKLAAVLVRDCVARCCTEGWRCGGAFEESESVSTAEGVGASLFVSFKDGCLVAADLGLRLDIFCGCNLD